MTRNRKIKKYGNTFIIPLSKLDLQDFNLEEGDEIDIENVLMKCKEEKVKSRKVEK